MDHERVMVLGSGGQLGRAVVERGGDRREVHAYTRQEIDVCDATAVGSEVARVKPAIVVNCSAFTDVDGAEDRQAEALRVNGIAVGVLARAAQAAGAVFVHYSTDFVFAGREDRAWTEADEPEPQGVYAQSKLMGEWLARDCARHYVLRVESLFGGPERKSTIDRITATLREGREMKLFHDRTVSPSFVDDVVEATWALVDHAAEPGVYHCVNSGATTWLGIGQTVARWLALDAGLLTPISVADVKMRAPRPRYAALSNAKLLAAGAAMPTWEDALARYLSRLSNPSIHLS
jgi:dTDP-4-dehydrorhamnose reductase